MRRRASIAAEKISVVGTGMAEEVTPEVIQAGMAVASTIADALDKLHTRPGIGEVPS